jgi:hypothetical protein
MIHHFLLSEELQFMSSLVSLLTPFGIFAGFSCCTLKLFFVVAVISTMQASLHKLAELTKLFHCCRHPAGASNGGKFEERKFCGHQQQCCAVCSYLYPSESLMVYPRQAYGEMNTPTMPPTDQGYHEEAT